jgi:hypothetical protein
MHRTGKYDGRAGNVQDDFDSLTGVTDERA